MIKSVTATNYLGESVKIVLTDDEPEHGLIIRSITGLGPPKAAINTTKLALSDGDKFNSSRIESRNIVIGLYFTYADSIEDARQRTYKFFPVKTEVTLIIETDNRLVRTTGYIESNEPDIFSKMESSQISIICPDPYFYKYGKDSVQKTFLSGVDPLFEFPFSNESLTEKIIEFGRINDKREAIIIYEGTHEIGLTITIHAIGNATNFMIYNSRTREIMKIDSDRLKRITGADISAGDDIIIKTSKNKKSLILWRNGQPINILNCVDKNTDWIRLLPGENILAFKADSGSEYLHITIENEIIYEGI